MFSLLKKLFDAVSHLFDPLVYGAEPIIHTVGAKYLSDYRLWLTFDNGTSGEIDLSQHIAFTGTLAPLADTGIFRSVFVEDGTICWPGDISMDPIVMYHLVMSLPIELVQPKKQPMGRDVRTPVHVS